MPTRRLALLAALLVAFAVLLALVVVQWGPLHRLDLRIADDLHRVALDHPGQTDFWIWVSRVLHPDVERVGALVAAVVLWFTNRRRAALFVVVVMVGEAVLDTAVKLAVGRSRPSFAHPVATAAGYSFPSGHALAAVVTVGLVVTLVPAGYKIYWSILGAGGALLVSYSRIAVGVHYLTDVIGAWLLGAAWLLVACWLFAGRTTTDDVK
jgi:membrane-associated phospholipid phosphatase